MASTFIFSRGWRFMPDSLEVPRRLLTSRTSIGKTAVSRVRTKHEGELAFWATAQAKLSMKTLDPGKISTCFQKSTKHTIIDGRVVFLNDYIFLTTVWIGQWRSWQEEKETEKVWEITHAVLKPGSPCMPLCISTMLHFSPPKRSFTYQLITYWFIMELIKQYRIQYSSSTVPVLWKLLLLLLMWRAVTDHFQRLKLQMRPETSAPT